MAHVLQNEADPVEEMAHALQDRAIFEDGILLLTLAISLATYYAYLPRSPTVKPSSAVYQYRPIPQKYQQLVSLALILTNSIVYMVRIASVLGYSVIGGQIVWPQISKALLFLMAETWKYLTIICPIIGTFMSMHGTLRQTLILTMIFLESAIFAVIQFLYWTQVRLPSRLGLGFSWAGAAIPYLTLVISCSFWRLFRDLRNKRPARIVNRILNRSIATGLFGLIGSLAVLLCTGFIEKAELFSHFAQCLTSLAFTIAGALSITRSRASKVSKLSSHHPDNSSTELTEQCV